MARNPSIPGLDVFELSDSRQVVPAGPLQGPPPAPPKGPGTAVLNPPRQGFTFGSNEPGIRQGPSLAQQAGNMARTIRNALPSAESAARAAAPAAVGAAAAAASRGLRQHELNNRPAFVPPANQNAPGQIPVDPTQTGPAPIAGRSLDQTEARRNIGNIAMALGGAPRAAATTVRGVGAVADGLRRALPFMQGGVAATQGFAAGDAYANEAPMVAAGRGDGKTYVIDDQGRTAFVGANYSNEGRNHPAPTGPRAGQIVKDGNSYSGVGDVKFGADIVDPSGKLLNSADPSKKTGGFGVTVLPGGGAGGFGPSAGGLFADQRLQEARMAAAARGTPFNADGSLGMSRSFGDGGITTGQSMSGIGGTTFSQDLRAKTDDIGSLLRSGKINSLTARAMVDAQEANQQMPIAQLRANTDLATNAASNATNRAISQESNQVSLRGQDVQAGSARARIAADQAAAQRTQANEDRRFQLDVARFGEDTAQKRATARQTATKNLYEEIANMIPPGKDGKPDTVTAARYADGLNAQLAEQVQAAQAELQRNPNNEAAKSFLANVDENGVAALSPVAKRRFIAGQQAAQKAKESDGWTWWSGTDPKSAAGVSGLRMKEGFIWDDYETLDSEGRVTGRIPASRVDEDRNLDILKPR